MHRLGIEITRRCNKKCIHCGKGDVQNVDISKEIIDKVIDEVSGIYIDSLRITGGESMLVPEIVEYIFNKIIEKKVYINRVNILTNGTIKSPLVIKSIKRLLLYLKEIEPAIKTEIEETSQHTVYNFCGIEGKKIIIIIGEDYHDNLNDDIEGTINFYNQIQDAEFAIVRQDSFRGDSNTIVLEGNAMKNYDILLGDIVKPNDMRIICNKFNFIYNYVSKPDCLILGKTISVSANGNVFVGGLMSYDNIDKNSLFNILACRKDFFERIEKYCWLHPISEKVKCFREYYLAIQFCREHNIVVEGITDDVWQVICAVMESSKAYEKLAKDMHELCPYLFFNEIDAMATATLCLELLNSKMPKQYIETYLLYCSVFDADDIANAMSAEWLRGFIVFLTDKDKERRIMNRQQNQSMNRQQRRKNRK